MTSSYPMPPHAAGILVTDAMDAVDVDNLLGRAERLIRLVERAHEIVGGFEQMSPQLAKDSGAERQPQAPGALVMLSQAEERLVQLCNRLERVSMMVGRL